MGLAVEKPDRCQRCCDAYGNDESDRVTEVIIQAGRTHSDGGGEADQGERNQHKPEWRYDAAGALLKLSRRLDGEPESAVQRERCERQQGANHRIPVENAGMGAGLPVSPQRQKEVAFGIEWNAAQDVSQSGTEEDREQGARKAENPVQQRAPDTDFDVVAQLQAYAAQDQQPEHNHQRQIEATEGRGVEQRKGEVERAAADQQPDLIAVPDGADAGKRGAALRLSAHQKQVKHTYAQIEAVEYHIAHDHHSNQPEPYKTHHDGIPFVSLFSAGWRISISVNSIGDDNRPVADFAIDQHSEQNAQQQVKPHEAQQCKQSVAGGDGV